MDRLEGGEVHGDIGPLFVPVNPYLLPVREHPWPPLLTEPFFRPVREHQRGSMLTEPSFRPARFGEPAFTTDNGFLAEVKAALAEITGAGRAGDQGR